MDQPFVYIIESPSQDDLEDHAIEGRVLKNGLDIGRIPHEYSQVFTQEEFFKSLGGQLGKKIQDFQKYPILHFAMHGSPNGILFTEDEFLDWGEFIRTLIMIKKLIDPFPLIICMSSCYESFAHWKATKKSGALSFDILVGNKDKTPLSDLAIAYLVFYNLLFDRLPIQNSLAIMQLASNNYNFEIYNAQEVQKHWGEIEKQITSDNALKIAQKWLNFEIFIKNGIVRNNYDIW